MNTAKKTLLTVAIIILFIRTAYSIKTSTSKKHFQLFDSSAVTFITSEKVIVSTFLNLKKWFLI
ncbi:hypothetical protein [Polaribacter glomeratus]|uniref:Uncharacterized protein n=1 Tax=Polaribacter glomeratus TaxID=102 RepID=A0A2S7WXW8_9FLAO|nr:hypothetical protein [Polaribacter glomeratus]PQJ82405.1 hypothetical protein BTO16_07360 [Polaribacter glomeratus]TXD64493.1 hypothetical protein ESX12_14285 [Polaribacter glomeratus]